MRAVSLPWRAKDTLRGPRAVRESATSRGTIMSRYLVSATGSQVRRLPVVGFDGELVGIVTLGDIARSAHSSPLHATELPGLARTLASITERRWPVAVQ